MVLGKLCHVNQWPNQSSYTSNHLIAKRDEYPCHAKQWPTPTSSFYGAHFYVSMKSRRILGPPLGHHKLSNIYASPLEGVWWRTVEPLRSNGMKNVCCRRGEPLPNAERLSNSDPVLTKRGPIFWG